MKIPLLHHRAETLIEILISVSVLTFMMSQAGTLYYTSMIRTAENRNNMLADLLVEDGINMATHLYGTNLLRFSSKTASCWNTAPEHSELADCENHKIADGKTYALSTRETSLETMWTEVSAGLGENPTLAADAEYGVTRRAGASTEKTFFREVMFSYPDHAVTDVLKVRSRVIYALGNTWHTFERRSFLIKPSI